MPNPAPCPNGCEHTDAEYRAFDEGVHAGRIGDARIVQRDESVTQQRRTRAAD